MLETASRALDALERAGMLGSLRAGVAILLGAGCIGASADIRGLPGQTLFFLGVYLAVMGALAITLFVVRGLQSGREK